MRNSVLSIVKVLLMLSALNGCGSGGDNLATDDIRQAQVTISASPVFPYDPLTANQYTLLVSNHGTQKVSLVGSKILNSSLPESINLSEIVDTSSCQEIAAGANCSLSVKLPYVKTNGYLNFILDYQDKLTAKNYPITKLIAFSRNITENNGMLYSLKYSERIIVNSDKFTFALPLSLKQDYAKLELQLAGQKASGYSAINCNSESGYGNHSNCTAIVELDGHIAYPKLSLKTTDNNGLENTINLYLNVEYNNTAHLVYLNAPLIVRATDTPLNVTVVNIGTATATNVSTPWTPSATIDLIQSSDCITDLLPNAICQLSYGQTRGESGGVGMLQQTVNYYGGAQGVQSDKFNVYRNSTALSAPSIDSVYPTNNEVVDNVKPVITVGFTQAVDSNTVDDNTFYVTEGTNPAHLAGTISFSATNVITFTPTADLTRGRAYKLTLKTNQIGNRAGKVSTTPNATEVIDFTIKQSAGTVTVVPNSATNIIMGDIFNFTASIDAGSSLVTAAFVNPLDGVITSNPTTCNLDATGTKSCIFSALVWNTSIANGATFYPQIIVSATNNAQIIGSPLSLTVNSSTVYLPATGQTTTSPVTATEGMDGWYQAGVAIDDSTRFTVGTGAQANCITDNLTGLMWIKDLNTINGGSSMDWSSAQNLIANTNAGSGWCGYKDWYLPTVNELSSLTNYSQLDPPATWLSKQGFNNVGANGYLSSTSFAPNNGKAAWYVNFINGDVGQLNKFFNLYVWPVRHTGAATSAKARVPVTGETGGAVGSTNGTAWPTGRFVVGSGTSANCVTDKLTGLVWIRDLNTVIIKGSATSGSATNWQNALDSVIQANATGGYCGYTDWRLPNVNELKSLANYGQSSVATWLNTQGFANVQANYYWSSTSYAPNNGFAWLVGFNGGDVDGNNKFNNNYVWPVRGGR